MNNGIKPTRLWYLTGKKHFRSIIEDREKAAPPLTPRNRNDVLQLMGIVFSGVFGLAYIYGVFDEKKASVNPCGPQVSKKPHCTPPTVPCPPKKLVKMRGCKSDE